MRDNGCLLSQVSSLNSQAKSHLDQINILKDALSNSRKPLIKKAVVKQVVDLDEEDPDDPLK